MQISERVHSLVESVDRGLFLGQRNTICDIILFLFETWSNNRVLYIASSEDSTISAHHFMNEITRNVVDKNEDVLNQRGFRFVSLIGGIDFEMSESYFSEGGTLVVFGSSRSESDETWSQDLTKIKSLARNAGNYKVVAFTRTNDILKTEGFDACIRIAYESVFSLGFLDAVLHHLIATILDELKKEASV